MNRLVNAVLLLKRLRRTGWVLADVKNPESVASHCFALAVLTMLTAEEKNLDVEKAVKIALIHDLPESYFGDLTPAQKQKIPKSVLRGVETAVLREILKELPDKIARSIQNLYAEYIDGKSPEARLVHMLDKQEMVNEALWLAARKKLDLEKFGLSISAYIRRGQKKR